MSTAEFSDGYAAATLQAVLSLQARLVQTETKLLRATTDLRRTVLALGAAEQDAIDGIQQSLSDIDGHVTDALSKAQELASQAQELAKLAQSDDEADKAKIAALSEELANKSADVVAALGGVAEHAKEVDAHIVSLSGTPTAPPEEPEPPVDPEAPVDPVDPEPPAGGNRWNRPQGNK